MIDEDEAYGLHCDIGRLEQENATLRQQLEDVTVSMGRLEERHAKTFEVGKRWMAKAARFESENTKLSELIYDRAHEYAIQHMTEDELRITLANVLDENIKLRELAAGIGHLLFLLDVDYCAACPRDSINHPCPVHTVKGGECLYETDLHDLGVEVNK